MGNQTKTWHVIPAVVATAIMSFCGVLIETAMNVTFPTFANSSWQRIFYLSVGS